MLAKPAIFGTLRSKVLSHQFKHTRFKTNS